MEARKLLLEIDFINSAILPLPDGGVDFLAPGSKKYKIDETLKNKFLNEQVSEFWHTDKDRLDFFQYFSDGNYFCQRSKKTFDFKTETYFYKTYRFKAGTIDQAREFYELLQKFFEVVEEVKDLKVEAKVKSIDQNIVLLDQRWYKLRRQKEALLQMTDWRVLSDVTEKYEGERDRWIAWRSWIRENTVPAPTDERFNGSGLEYFKYTHELLFPLDPKNYRKLYPNDMLEDGVTPAPAFLDENDSNQWVKHDSEASSDFMRSREENIYNLSKRGIVNRKKISQELIDLMRLLRVDEEIPVNWSKYHTDESEL